MSGQPPSPRPRSTCFLHVGPLDADGFHPICSLMAFADVGDRLRLHSGGPARPHHQRFPSPPGLDAGEDNLVMRAARGASRRGAALRRRPVSLALTKEAAAGGWGSAAGRATPAPPCACCGTALTLQIEDCQTRSHRRQPGLGRRGLPVGPAGDRRGQGEERLSPAPRLAAPRRGAGQSARVASPTGPVYRAYDAAGAPGERRSAGPLPDAFESAEELASFMALCRNDLEAPARARLTPAIADVLGHPARRARVPVGAGVRIGRHLFSPSAPATIEGRGPGRAPGTDPPPTGGSGAAGSEGRGIKTLLPRGGEGKLQTQNGGPWRAPRRTLEL